MNTGKYGLEKTPYLDTFYPMSIERLVIKHFASEDCDIVLAHFQDDARFRNDTLIAFYFPFPSCL